jgi:ABC-type phosphate transport system substrate-binding protein
MGVAGLALLGIAPLRAAHGSSVVVIVNTSNPVTELTSREVSRLLLKKVTKWSAADTAVVPADQNYGYQVTDDFCREIHGRDVGWLRSYWRKMVFSGRGYPPPQLKSDSEVISHVAGSAGGIGYVSPDAKLPEGVKAVTISDA